MINDKNIELFQKQFNCTLAEGRKYHVILEPEEMFINSGKRFPEQATISTKTQPGVNLDMPNEKFLDLVQFSLEGLDHDNFRKMHPSAQALYDQYMTLYLLTKQDSAR